jgi:sugar phosphate isomerase/epimerase
MLDVSPPDLVAAAAAADLDFIGLRVAAGGPDEQLWPLAAESRLLRETLRRLDDTGLYVNDVDVLALRPGTHVTQVEPALDLAARLTARYVIAFIEDDDLARVADLLAALAEPATARGLRLLIEPMSYKQVSTLAQAQRLVAEVPETGIVIDPLQFIRSGDTLDDVRALNPATTPLLQLCDGPLRAPATLPRLGQLPRGQSPGTSISQLEARAWRLPPCEGELPLTELANLLPNVPISVEAPNLGLSRLLDPVSLARRHRSGLDRVLKSSSLMIRTAG